MTDNLIRTDVRGTVIETAASVLAVDGAALTSAGKLSDLPTFNSFRMVEIVERLESRFGLEIDPADLTPDNLLRVDALAALVERTLGGERG
jgi:acyl carrier protein